MRDSLKKLFTGTSGPDPARSIFFHEDDYCQIELLPVVARQHCISQMGVIDEFAARHDAGGMGYTSLHVRPEAPHGLAELGIVITAFSAAISRHFPAYDTVFTGYSSSREICKHTHAWGGDSWTLFADHEANIVQHAWLDLGKLDAAESERIMAALRDLPRSEDLLIADWSWSLVAVLSDTASFLQYFQQRMGNL